MDKYFLVHKEGEIKVSGDLQAEFGNRDGIFAAWDWDGEKLTVTNDRYGFYPMFYAEEKGKFAVSPSLTKLIELGFKQDFDEDAFSVFLRFGWFIGEDTMFKSIRALPPGSVLSWEKGKIEISSRGIIKSKKADISRAEAIKVYGELLQKAVEKTLPESEDFVVPLSGGRDSRHILFALAKAGRKPAACLTLFHLPPRSNEDAKIAPQICETLGIKHQLLAQPASRLDSEKRKNYLTGFSVFEHGWYLAMSDFINGKWNTVYDGIAGDVLSVGLSVDAERVRLFKEGKIKELAGKVLEGEGYLPALLSKEIYRRFSRERAIHHLAKELERHAETPNPIGSYYFWNRTRRCIALSPFRLLPSSAKIIMPYLDQDVFDFLSSLPVEIILDGKFHTETITFTYPEYADIPFENKKAPPLINKKHFRNYSREILLFALTKRKKKLLNRNALFSRCLRGMIDGGYGRNVTDFAELAINLMQLERLS